MHGYCLGILEWLCLAFFTKKQPCLSIRAQPDACTISSTFHMNQHSGTSDVKARLQLNLEETIEAVCLDGDDTFDLHWKIDKVCGGFIAVDSKARVTRCVRIFI